METTKDIRNERDENGNLTGRALQHRYDICEHSPDGKHKWGFLFARKNCEACNYPKPGPY